MKFKFLKSLRSLEFLKSLILKMKFKFLKSLRSLEFLKSLILQNTPTA
jgi:hypothetical protein